MILETPRKPCLPIQRLKRSALQSAIATMARFTSSETRVNTIPTVSIRMRRAVSNAGPAIKGNKDGNKSDEKFLSEIAHLALLWRFYTIQSADSTSMTFRHFVLLIFGSAFVAHAGDLKSIDSYRDAAAKTNAQLTIPDWEQ